MGYLRLPVPKIRAARDSGLSHWYKTLAYCAVSVNLNVLRPGVVALTLYTPGTPGS